jgi:hypothetical protein
VRHPPRLQVSFEKIGCAILKLVAPAARQRLIFSLASLAAQSCRSWMPAPQFEINWTWGETTSE